MHGQQKYQNVQYVIVNTLSLILMIVLSYYF